MFENSVKGVSVRYGLLGGIVSFLYSTALYFIYEQNPYSEQTELSATLLFIPIFVFLGVQYFKKYIDSELGFSTAFKVAIIIVVVLGITIALLQVAFTLVFHNDLVQEFIREAQADLIKGKAELMKSIGKENYEMMKQEVSNRTALSLGVKQMSLRWLVGFFISIVSAVFFRK